MSQPEFVLILGAASGIGREVAYTFAERGVKGLFLADLNEAAANETAEHCKKYAALGPELQVIASRVDVSQRGEVEDMVTKAIAALGRIDAAVNSAGVGAKMELPVTEMPTEEFDRVHNINARGMFFCTSAIARAMLSQDERFVQGRNGKRSMGKGSIINISSLNGQMPISMHVQYGSSKYAALGITLTAAAELARKNIRVNCLMPSWVDTKMMEADFARSEELPATIQALSPLGRMAFPEEIAEAAYFLSGPGASYIHGVSLVVDAGISLTRGLA